MQGCTRLRRPGFNGPNTNTATPWPGALEASLRPGSGRSKLSGRAVDEGQRPPFANGRSTVAAAHYLKLRANADAVFGMPNTGGAGSVTKPRSEVVAGAPTPRARADARLDLGERQPYPK